MKYAEIKKLFTEKAAEVLAQGWTIHTEGMSGSQGELAKIAFERKNEAGKMEYAVLFLKNKYHDFHEYVRLVWAMAEESYTPKWTLWLDHSRPVECREWMAVNRGDWYIDKDQQAEWEKIHDARRAARRSSNLASKGARIYAIGANDPIFTKIYHLAKKHMQGGWKLRRKNCERALVEPGNDTTYAITLWHDDTMHVFHVGYRAAYRAAHHAA